MASATVTPLISIEQYLKTVYRPDVDYVDGRIEERNSGEYDHGTLQAVLYGLCHRSRRDWNIRVALDTRVQTAPHRFRVPDVSVSSLEAPKEQIIRTPPLLCIEVLSPEDTVRKMRLRSEDYFAMGVPCVWIFDPANRVVTICQRGGVTAEQRTGLLTLPGTPIALSLEETFACLDED